MKMLVVELHRFVRRKARFTTNNPAYTYIVVRIVDSPNAKYLSHFIFVVMMN